ncbi:hypothetical protein ScPMuIL_002347 [Solemya velum]
MGIFLTKFWKSKEVRIIIQGLDAAGKTTILYRLKLGEVVTTIPTIGFNVETISYNKVNITAWDVGGRDKMRPLFRHYYAGTDAILFVVDSNDRERISQIADELQTTVNEDQLRDAVFCIIANKQDLVGAMSVEEVYKELNLRNIKQKHSIFPASAIKGEGLYEPLDWLTAELAKRPPKPLVTKSTKQSTEGKAIASKSNFSFFSDTFYSFKKTILG